MQNYLLRQIAVVNEGEISEKDVYLKNGRIERIGKSLHIKERVTEIDGSGKHLIPGIIDDQVHFREPGLMSKATIYSESRAAAAGGVTSFMDMPNTIPNALTEEILENKYSIASRDSLINYSFFMGSSNDNAEEILKMNRKKKNICGVKIFMGSSTGNMLVDDESVLSKIFANAEMLIATHCEDEEIIKNNYQQLKIEKGNLEPSDHPVIRNAAACYKSSSFAISLAQKFDSRLHILHISTAEELGLFTNKIPLPDKKVTAEVCVHHLHFTADDYADLGYRIKCNPAIKSPENKEALWEALLDDRLDIIATDHAPHTLSEKEPPYEHAHSGLPLVQHSLLLMLTYYKQRKISLEKIVEKMCHAVAECFSIEERGFIREGYYADVIMLNLDSETLVNKNNILYKCGWSPLEGTLLSGSVLKTFVNGNCVFDAEVADDKQWDNSRTGHRLMFGR